LYGENEKSFLAAGFEVESALDNRQPEAADFQ
jgi:hypothetical protein